MSGDGFVHLRMHSEYDVHNGAARLSGDDSVVDYAAQMQQPALALTDSGCLFGAIKFYERCRAKGVKPIIGCELKIDHDNDHSLLLLCASHEGYVNLNRLISRTYSEGKNAAANPEWMTAETTQGIIALSGAARGDIGDAIDRARLDTAEKRAREWQARFPDRFYIEVWRTAQDDKNRAAAAADIAQRLGLPLVATHPVQCTRKEDEEVLNIKLCITAGYRLADPQRPKPFSADPYLLSGDEMRERFADLPGALDNSRELAKRCNFTFKFGEVHLPTLPQQAVSSKELLQQEAEAGLAKKLPSLTEEARQEYGERLAFELKTINEMDFADYFLIVMDFIRWAKQNDIPVGPGRGSGAGSLVAYALDITTLNPLRYDLLFERFLNPERVSMPDFDVDFCVNGRDRVIEYVENRYGKERVSQIVTFGTIGAKSAMRDVGRVLGMPYTQCDRIARLIPDGVKVTIADALRDSKEFADAYKDSDNTRLIDLAKKVEGLPRNIGTHAGGVLIAPEVMENFCPKYAAMDTETLVSQYDMLDIEKIGLVKFDFLGLRTLTILADAEREVRRQVNPDFDFETVPMDDKATFDLYTSGNMMGVFQCESAGIRELMKNLKPDRFTDLIALVALYRPGPLNAKMDASYINRKHGREDVSYPHPSLEKVLEDTYGLFIYQEQVMDIARLISGYSLGEADILRRAMGKKDEKKMAGMRESFVKGSDGKMAQGAAQKLFNDMAQFAEYGFNKSHAAAYALLSYRTAYAKAHHKAIFLAAVLSAEADNTDRVKLLVKDARQAGITVTTPDINNGVADFRALNDKTIQFGLKAIKGVGMGMVQQIINLRGDQPFRDIFDFCTRAAGTVPAAALELLAQAGAFDSLHSNRAAVCATIPSLLAQNVNSANLFAAADGGQDTLADVPAWSLRDTLLNEKLAFGFPFSAHYYKLYENILPKLPLDWQRLDKCEVREQAIVAGNPVSIRRRRGRNGTTTMLILGDEKGEIEVQVPQEKMKEMMKDLSSDTFAAELLLVQGRMREDTFRSGACFLMAKAVWRLDDFLQNEARQITVRCAPSLSMRDLHKLLQPNSGKGKQIITLVCEDEGMQYDVDLGGGWGIGHECYQSLLNTPGIMEVLLKCDSPYASATDTRQRRTA